jgi:alkylation response protein AidB-like acyl-CoA dehydrogenase
VTHHLEAAWVHNLVNTRSDARALRGRCKARIFELAIHAKVFGSEAAVRVITHLMQVVGVDSYGLELPLAGLLQDAMLLPLFGGGNIGVRRQLHALMQMPDYNPLAASGN